MNNILLIGAGRSASTLIEYLLNNSEKEQWKITVAELSLDLAIKKINGHKNASPLLFDINNDEQRTLEVQKADLVISMLPAHMHIAVAKDCLTYKKHMVTASYVSKEMQALNQEAKKAGITLMNEIGVDPGIDHMSAMKIIDEIKAQGGKIISFESFTGGLLAPESEKDNPWKYKFSWNPRNVILAGQGAVKFLHEGNYKYIPYHKLFRRTEILEVEGYGKFEGYANRDSISYREVYDLNDIRTIYRGTLRRPGYCKAWDVFVQLGATDDSYEIEDSENMTYREFIDSFLPHSPGDSVELKLSNYLKIDQDDFEIHEKLSWLGIFENTKVGLKKATPAQILQHIMEQKWTLDKADKDMIVMVHKFEYELNGIKKHLQSSMVITGDDTIQTAMSKTVGLPVAIAAKLILDGTIKDRGVLIPVSKSIYEPVLNELKTYGIDFVEKIVE